MENKFREIFIAQTESGKPVILNLAEHPDSLFASISKGVKYIEIEAVEQLKAEKDNLEQLNSEYKWLHQESKRMRSEITALKSKLKIAVEKLTSISKNSCCDTCQEAKLVALSGLSKIGGEM